MTAPVECIDGQDVQQAAVPDEDHSTGTAWHAPRLHSAVALPEHITPCPPAEQAQHRAELAEAISGFAVGVAISQHRDRTASQGGTDGK
ncbi:hypothetical protein B0675_02105 [Streptomyces sp. M41(2017)]|uniref:hypothetical protein n=1 Tax=Streptomyces sp. M41(2017) TaxID=1955065 RepID=UPI0009BDB0E8|nr:hypothetical protein [Streptomyces sp. M41(2017)]OQQ16102.1 hypothetical protein B0675_02105 [Streptomyces sp. M41(2017)]